MSLPSLQAEREKWKKGITMYTTTIAPTVATAGILTVGGNPAGVKKKTDIQKLVFTNLEE